MNVQTITDAFVPVDMETDMVIEDSFIDTDRFHAPTPVVSTNLNEPATPSVATAACLVGDGCLGIREDDRNGLLAACERTCGFNTATRNLLCNATPNDCSSILTSLYEADQTLNALCNFDDTFSEEPQNA